MSHVFFRIALAFIAWGMVSAIAMATHISKRGHKISIFFFRFMIYKYIHQYTEITKQEDGKPGARLQLRGPACHASWSAPGTSV